MLQQVKFVAEHSSFFSYLVSLLPASILHFSLFINEVEHELGVGEGSCNTCLRGRIHGHLNKSKEEENKRLTRRQEALSPWGGIHFHLTTLKRFSRWVSFLQLARFPCETLETCQVRNFGDSVELKSSDVFHLTIFDSFVNAFLSRSTLIISRKDEL